MKNLSNAQNLQPLELLAAAVVLLHLFASLAEPSNAAVTSFGVLLCDAVACYACFLRSRRSSGTMQSQWRLIALFFLFNSIAALLLHLRIEFIGPPQFRIGIDEFTALLRGIPLLVAVVLPEFGRQETQDSPFALVIASVQTLLLLALAYYTLFFIHPLGAVSTIPGTIFPTTPNFLVEYILFASTFTLRLLARSSRQWTRFYAPVACFLWSICFLNFLAPRWKVPAGSPYYLTFDFAILLFALYAGRKRPAVKAPRSSGAIYLNLVGPVVFPLVTFAVAVVVAATRFNLGIEIMGLSLTLFALRTTSLQLGYRRMQEHLLEDNQATMLEARIDQLTGIPNRRSFDRTLDREWRRAERTHQPIGLLMIDVDKFKHLNDTQGHPAGDRTLKRIASILDAKLTRATDFVARYGGEEFSVILTDTSPQDIKAIAESLRAAVAEAKLPNNTEIGPCVSISIGAALTFPASPLTPSSLLSGADQALYRAKHNGRNRVEFANLLETPSTRAQTDGALQALVSNYKESVFGPEVDPLAHRDKRALVDRRAERHPLQEADSGAMEIHK